MGGRSIVEWPCGCFEFDGDMTACRTHVEQGFAGGIWEIIRQSQEDAAAGRFLSQRDIEAKHVDMLGDDDGSP